VSVIRVLSCSNANEEVEPRYSWTNHTLPVTDVHVGCGGCRARVATASRDKTVKVVASTMSGICLLILYVIDIFTAVNNLIAQVV